MIKTALRVMMVGVLSSTLAATAVSAGETRGTAVDAPKARTTERAQVKPGRVAATPVAAQPATPFSRKLYQHTTSMGTQCCAPCEVIASDGSCKTWGQCSPGVTACDAWTN